jgi:xanthosine utilization system XapX-like protein
MKNSVYQINKGINKSIEFKGLKAQYIWYFGGGMIVLMIFFAVLYIIGLPSFVCIGIIGLLGALLVFKIYKMSRKYGEFGMMKALAKRQVPKAIRVQSRNIFKMQK